MNGPAKNRLHDYEAGWLTLLLNMGVAEERALREAQNRVAQAAIDEMNARRGRRRAARPSRLISAALIRLPSTGDQNRVLSSVFSVLKGEV